jgi:hypothetical protein
MKQHMTWTAVLALTGLLILSIQGCSTTSKDERSEGRRMDDKNITSHIRKELDEEPVYKFNGVDVKAFAGIVQLSGFVNTDPQKRRAEEIASQTPGVTEVHNALVLKPVPVMPTGATNAAAGNRIYSPQNSQSYPNQTPTQK